MADGSEIGVGRVVAVQRAIEFGVFLREQRAALAGFLRRRLPTEEDAEDVVQESMMRMLPYSESEPAVAWKPLLYRVATNAACDHARRRASRFSGDYVSLDDEEIASGAPLPEQVIEDEQELAIIGKAILRLSPKCRQVFLLHRMEGMTYSEIAVHFGISESMVRKYISKAIAHLAAVVAQATGPARIGAPEQP